MASTVLCSIVSAEEEIFTGQVEMVVATGTIGELGLLPGHTPLLTGVRPGPVRLILEGGEEELFYASGGYLEVQPTSITILADTALRAEDLDEVAAIEAQKQAEKDLADQKSDIDFARVAADLREQAAILRTIQKTNLGKKLGKERPAGV
jgi:F-type H+-transporting ATPase subunit epsilon